LPPSRSARRLAALLVQLCLLVSAVALLPPRTVAATPDWLGEYFSNTTLSGSPTLTRNDAEINFDWGSGAPDPSLPTNNFSVRWTRSIAFAEGRYRFTTTTDDGVRLYVDEVLVIDKWVAQSATSWQAEVTLTAGDHDVRMEYFEGSATAVAKLVWEPVGAAINWLGEYFNNATLTGSPTLTRDDTAIDFNWGSGSPHPSLPTNNFSVRWTRTIASDEGRYRFTTTTDDGVRLWVDDVLLIDKWVSQSATSWQAEVTLTAGDHDVRMEYFEGSGSAVAKLVLEPVDPVTDWLGEYFSNATLSGPPTLTRNDTVIDFDWGSGSPHPSIPTNNFSVRWTRTLDLTAGTYTFGTYIDDGVRLYVDGVLVIDQFVVQSAKYWSAEVPLTTGPHTVVLEYFEGVGTALARLTWAKPTNDGVIRINTGGPGYVDRLNRVWSTDQHFIGGVMASTTRQIYNTLEDPLYLDERALEHAYSIPVASGTYIVRLHFVELFKTSTGSRQFDVLLEGTKILDKFDIYREAGQGALITRSFPVSISDGNVDLQFKKVFENPVIHAIDIHPASTSADLTVPAFAPIPQPENASYIEPPTVDLSVSDAGGLDDGFWRIDNLDPVPLFTDAGTSTFQQTLTIPASVFDALSLGAHRLSIGAADNSGNASVATWRFRKTDSASGSAPISFNQRTLVQPGAPGTELLSNPTTLEVGPDGRLYVGQQNGYIHVLTLDADGNVASVQRIDTIRTTPNFNPDGSPASVVGRHLLGIDFDPRSTPSNPILWAVHSDPRFCFNTPLENCHVDTHSGMITRLVGPSYDAASDRLDVVTGLPRSREIHAPNAVHFGPDGWLYLTVGSHTNNGAPSAAFTDLAETHQTAAVLRVNVNGAPSGTFPLDVEQMDTSGGELAGVFEIFATGYRNAYDFVWHSNGRMYLNTNAANSGNGTTPGPEHGCPDGVALDPGTLIDFLSVVDEGDFGGHPNPPRGECILNDGSQYPTPLPPEPNFDAPIHHYLNGASVNGVVEYHVPTFGGQMLGDLITVSWGGDQSVRRLVLTEDGSDVLFDETLANMSQPLDVEVGPDGSIYVAEHGDNTVQVLEPATALTGSWATETPIPVPALEVGVVACEGKVYVIGGLVTESTNTHAVWVYDPTTKAWTRVADHPGTAVDHAGAACVNGKVYLVGGLIKANTPVSQVLEYTPATDTWAAKASLPRARGAMGVAVLDGIIYAAGGLIAGAGPVVSDMTAYNPVTNTWTQLAPMPTARDHLSMEAVGDRLFAIGGRDVSVLAVLAANEAYIPATNTWETRAPLPVPRGGMASATLHGQIVLWGGEGNHHDPDGTFEHGDMYDPVTNRWQEIAPQPTPRHGTDGAQIGDRVFVPAGGPKQGASITDVNEVFSFISTDAPPSCIADGSDPTTTDSDGDGYTDQDEADNGTDPCSAASRPPDADADGISDRNDPDDDNDGVPDTEDQFQLDPQNGLSTTLPWTQEWNPGSEPAGGFGNSGFPGVQLTTNGVGFITERVHAGGAGGFLTIVPTAGTYQGTANTQDNALQVGFNGSSATAISTRIADPLAGQEVIPGKQGGIFVGTDEDNYVELIVTTDTGAGATGIVFASEFDGAYGLVPGVSPVEFPMPGPGFVELFLDLDPAAGTITAAYRVDSTAPVDRIVIGSIALEDEPRLAGLFINGLGTGVRGTNTTSSSFAVAYDYYRIEEGAEGDTSPPAPPADLAAAAGDGRVDLTWSPNSEPDLAGYDVYRSTTSGSGYTKLNSSLVTASAYADTTATNGTTYYYVVTAVDTSNNPSSFSNQASATPTAPADTTPPAAPTGLTATASSSSVALDWANNVEADLAGYNVYRSQTSGSGYSKLNNSLIAGSAYTDATVVTGTTYHYVVRAVDTSGNESGNSAQASAAVPSATSMSTVLTSTASNSGKNWVATVTVTVRNASGDPVSNANVAWTWSNGATGSGSCTTGADGRCSDSRTQAKRVGSVRFNVTSVTHGTLTWTGSQASITVTKP
jgi:glucose/arabinose dehydrogenase